MPLLWVLRDTLGLTGTKFGCGMSLCGACTIEGLSPDRTNPIQQAWIAEDVPQCGYCQSGQIMTAAALLAKTANPTDADIDEAMRNNICRCGTYQSIRRAVHLAAELRSKGGAR
jgi:isoquinoline 1-oxidoreductase alpha subunit